MTAELTIVQVQDALGIKVTADMIKNVLQVKPARAEKRACWWSAEQFDDIRMALITHIRGCRVEVPSAPSAPAVVATVEFDDDDEL